MFKIFLGKQLFRSDSFPSGKIWVKFGYISFPTTLLQESIKKAIEDVRAFYEQKLSYMLNELETLKKKSSLKETGFSSANSSNERLELEKSGRSELEYRSSSAPPASISNGLLSSSEN